MDIVVFQNPNSKEILSKDDLIFAEHIKTGYSFVFCNDKTGKKWKIGWEDCVIYEDNEIPDSLEEIIDDLYEAQSIANSDFLNDLDYYD